MNDYAMGLGLGMIVALGVYGIFALAARRKKDGCAQQYDERQLAAQGKAAKAAMYTHMVYAGVCIAFSAGWSPAWLDVPTAIFFGVALSVGVYAVICVLRDAYFNISRSPRATLILLGSMAAAEFLVAGRRIEEEGLLPDGKLRMTVGMSLACGAVLAVVLVTALIKLAADKRQEARDEES